MAKQLIYLDNAAATPLDSDVLDRMMPYFKHLYFNPSANYLPAKNVKSDIDQARKLVASRLGAKPQEIVFTAGATEANNLAITGIMSQYPDGNIVVSEIEHESVIEPAKKFNYKFVKVDKSGLINLDDLAKKIDSNTVLVSIMLANNEIGVVQSFSKINKILEDIRKNRKNKKPLYLHSDGAQAGSYLDLHTSRIKVDLLSLNGGKIYGPKQSGCLFVKSSVNLSPLILGGGQEYNLRSGTENVAGIIGFSYALEKAQSLKQSEVIRLRKLQAFFIETLAAELPKANINGTLKHRLPNNVHITIPGSDNEKILLLLEQEGILAAAGSACSASNELPSHVLKAIGISDIDARSSVRFSFGRDTSLSELKKTIKTLVKIS